MDDSPSTARTLTLWHQGFYQLVIERGSPSTEVRTEVSLSQHPSRADLLLLRRIGEPRQDHKARTLRGLWPLLSDITIADFKSPTRAFRASDLVRLLRYGLEYTEVHLSKLASKEMLTQVLFVPRMNKALRAEIEFLGCQLHPVSGGYARLTGPILYNTYIVFLDEVANTEQDEYLRLFTTHRDVRDVQARRWMGQWLIGKSDMQNIKDMEGYEEILRKLLDSFTLEERLAGVTLEERLAGVTLEERLAGVTLEERLAGVTLEERLAGATPEQIIKSLPLPDKAREALLALLAKQTEQTKH